jgi:hypothetical protein
MESEPKPADNLPEEDEQARIKRMNKQIAGIVWEMGWKSMAVAVTFGAAAVGYGAYKWYKNKHPSPTPAETKDDTPAAPKP